MIIILINVKLVLNLILHFKEHVRNVQINYVKTAAKILLDVMFVHQDTFQILMDNVRLAT